MSELISYDSSKTLQENISALNSFARSCSTSVTELLSRNVAESDSKGWHVLRCKTHRKYRCNTCSCSICGYNCGCNHHRSLRDYHETPSLPEKKRHIRRVGIELEAVSISSNWNAIIEEWPWACYDGSLPYQGMELKFVGYESNSKEVFPGIIEHLTRVLGLNLLRVTPSCGLHVHVERTDQDNKEDVAERWVRLESEMCDLFPSRRTNTYCMPIGEQDYTPEELIEEHSSIISWSYHHKTVEFRLHHGTTRWPVILGWADWCTNFIRRRMDRNSPGARYLRARKAHIALCKTYNVHRIVGSPTAWSSAIMLYAQKHGHERAWDELQDGRFSEAESPDTLEKFAEKFGVNPLTTKTLAKIQKLSSRVAEIDP